MLDEDLTAIPDDQVLLRSNNSLGHGIMNEIKQNSPYAWFLAARPKTLTGAIIPVLLGSALAFSLSLIHI